MNKRPMKVRYDKQFENEEQIAEYMVANPTHIRMNYETFTGLRKRPTYITVMFEYQERA